LYVKDSFMLTISFVYQSCLPAGRFATWADDKVT
jgi:hypothetical protein